MGLTYILLGDGVIAAQLLRPLTCSSSAGRCLDMQLIELNWNYNLLFRKEAISLWSCIFFCLLFDTFPVISAQKSNTPEKIHLQWSRVFSNLAGCLQLLLPQPWIATISFKTSRKQSQNTLVVLDVAKSPMFFPCSDTASFSSIAAC